MRNRLIVVRAANDVFQRLESLQRNRLKRQQSRLFIVEGVRLINAALSNRWEIEGLVCQRERRLSSWASKILRDQVTAHIYELLPELFERLSRKEDKPELMAVVRIPNDDLQRIKLGDPPLVIVLDRPSNPGNLGSIIRSTDALGADGVVIYGHSADLYDPETVSATTGSLFALPVLRVGTSDALLSWIRLCESEYPDLQIVGSDENGSSTLSGHSFSVPTMILVGNETRGLSGPLKALCEAMVKIPIYGHASSLNVACALSIFLYEAARQRANEGLVVGRRPNVEICSS
jgi:23S rRNA (uridine2479-2'-O)-methyltransferase